MNCSGTSHRNKGQMLRSFGRGFGCKVRIDSENNITALPESPATDRQLETFATEEELAACALHGPEAGEEVHGPQVGFKGAGGKALDALLVAPAGMTVGKAGNLYFATHFCFGASNTKPIYLGR